MSTDKYSSDFALAAGQSVKERDYWLKKLSGNLEKTILPYDSGRIEPKPGEPEMTTFQISGELFTKLNWISNNTDILLLAVLAGAINLLINKYTENTDIIIGMPIYKQSIEGDFINTVLAIRTQLHPKMTFKELLYQVKTAIDEAIKNQNYPIKALLYDLGLPYNEEDFPLFDITLTVENLQDRKYITHLHTHINFSFLRTDRYLEGKVAYDSLHYRKDTVARIIDHFTGILREAINNVNTDLHQISPLSETEKKRLMEEFNNTRRDFPDADKKLPGIFADQVERTPDQIALVFDHIQLSYRGFNEKADRLAGLLCGKGIGTHCIAALLMESSPAIPISIMGVLKAGGAYLPIDPGSPAERIDYMLKDSNAKVLLINKSEIRNPELESPQCGHPIKNINDQNKNRHFGIPFVLNFEHLNFDMVSNFEFRISNFNSANLAYIIYTSGSTGKPKGVMVEHKQAVNTLMCRKDEYKMSRRTTALQLFSYAFDGFVTGFFTPLFSGAVLVLLSRRSIEDISKIINIISTHQVTHFISVPVLYQAILANITEKEAASLQVVTLAGDKLPPNITQLTLSKNNKIEIVNEYGITEAAVMSTIYRNQQRHPSMKIGHPIWNTRIYITQPGAPGQIKPIGVHGEICLAGAGLARGYMNNPELTDSKFVENPFTPGEKLLRTGDMGRWLPDGNIEFTGRIDLQVKVRGFRIELGEIERHLLAHVDIKESIVTAVENDEGDKNLCAYIVSARQLSVSEIREYLAGHVPEYMIPAYFVMLEGLPLSPNGKIDRKQLPPPSAAAAGAEYTAPRNGLERQLVDIWAEILGVERDSVSINANFFELGGHSLKATILLNRIIKEFNARIAMIEIFKSPTIRAIAEEIKRAVKNGYEAIEPVPIMAYYDVSHAQKRLWVLEHFAGGLSAYNIADWYIFENLNQGAFEKALETVVKRHESIRTTFITVDGEPKQKINDYEQCGFKIEYMDLRQAQDREKIMAKVLAEEANTPFNLELGPLLRVKFLYLPANRTLFVVAMHHIISDGWSLQILKNELLTLYKAYCHKKENPLPPLRIQYKNFTAWQNKQLQGEALAAHQEYWRECFKNEIPLLNLETDFPRPPVKSYNGSDVKFSIDLETYHQLTVINRTYNTTFLMTLTALLVVLLHRYTGQEDIIIGLPVSGRDHVDLENQVGFYVNTLPIRVCFKTGDTFETLISIVKNVVLSAFEHQVYPFDRMVEDLGFNRDKSRSPLFDIVLQYLNFEGVGEELEIEVEGAKEEIRSVLPDNRNISMGITTSKFDLVFNFSESKTLDGNIIYNTDLFEKQSIVIMIERLKAVLREIAVNPKISLARVDIEIGFEKEMKATVNPADFDFE